MIDKPSRTAHINILPNSRICVGRHMANNSLFIDIATLLWAASISAVKDEAGNPIVPDTLDSENGGFSM